ncbi:MAG: hypothetical protein ACPHSE_06100 [Flavobacteriaceae bacterium]
MKKAFLLIAFVTFSLQAQTVFQLQVVNIDPLDTDQFEMVEKKFAQPLAQEAKDKGIIADWFLMKKTIGGKVSDKQTYIWVHVYKNVQQMTKARYWWQTQEKYGVPASIIYGSVEREYYGSFTYKTEKSFDTNRPGKYVILNWAKPTNLGATIALADKISDSFKSNMKKSGMTSWGMATRVYPQGSEFAPLFFWDGYESYEQVLEHLMNKAVLEVVTPEMFAQLSELLPQGFDNRIIMENITGTN